MDIQKKELGENITINLDLKQFRWFSKEIKKLAKQAEYNSNPKNIKYIFAFNGREKPYMDVTGWCSRVLNKNGLISEVIFIDYDNILFRIVEEEMKYVIEKHDTTPFYIFKTAEKIDENGEVFGNYLCVSITKKTFIQVSKILEDLHCDSSYKLVPRSYRFKTWVLRLSKKGKRDAPEFKCVIGDLDKEYPQDASQGHLEVIKQVYPTIPDIKYKNLDGNQKVYLTSYITASS